jgi:hypothetical protein
MAKLLNLSVDVTKIDKTKLYPGKKGTYLKLTVAVNDEADQFGNTVSCWQEQSQEERQGQEPKRYLGNGKVFWTNENQQPAQQPQRREAPAYGQQADGVNHADNRPDDIPF